LLFQTQLAPLYIMASKGFNIKVNPDERWSNAFYRALEWVQTEDGRGLLLINRDDQAGARTGTIFTNSKHKTFQVVGERAIGTRTDYMPKHKCLIQPTNYLFQHSKNTTDASISVVKSNACHPKSPAQHYRDLVETVQTDEVVADRFKGADGQPKQIEFYRVDGGSDEGPSHIVVQYYHALRHLTRGVLLSLVTARHSGGSFLNNVERLNGSQGMAASNLFIPTTLLGSNSNDRGEIDDEKVSKSMLAGIRLVYLPHVDGAAGFNGPLHLVSPDPTAAPVVELCTLNSVDP
jgi:hypothetical protein